MSPLSQRIILAGGSGIFTAEKQCAQVPSRTNYYVGKQYVTLVNCFFRRCLSMQYRTTSLAGVMILTPTTFSDHRGQFSECFRQDEFEQHCGHYPLVQDNLSRSVGGTLRGLHYQHSRPQGKLVQVISGSIFDVAVDIRPASPTYGQWLGCLLNADIGGGLYGSCPVLRTVFMC